MAITTPLRNEQPCMHYGLVTNSQAAYDSYAYVRHYCLIDNDLNDLG